MKTVTAVLATVSVLFVVECCHFPDFLQSRNTGVGRKWMIYVVDDGSSRGNRPTRAPRCGSVVDFDGGTWRHVFPEQNGRCTTLDGVDVGSYRRECVTAVQRNRYVVRHYDVITSSTAEPEDEDILDDGSFVADENDGDDDVKDAFARHAWEIFDVSGTRKFRGYTCVEFIRRGPTVVQIRLSKAYRWLPGSSACDDEADLSLVHWPLVDYGQSFFDSPTCALPIGDGGFSIRMFDKAGARGLCDALDGETRAEVGCAYDDGGDDGLTTRLHPIDFRFRHAGCVPDGFGMSVDQRVYCVASWIDSEVDNNGSKNRGSAGGFRHAFAVLRHDTDLRAWCFRYTMPATTRSTGRPSFTATLFRDLRCDRARSTNVSTERYLRIDFVGDEPIFDDRLSLLPTRKRKAKTSPSAGGSNDEESDDYAIGDDEIDLHRGSRISSFVSRDATPTAGYAIEDEDQSAEDFGQPIVSGSLLCRDDYEVCSFWNRVSQPCRQSSGPEVLSCPRRCGVCSDRSPTPCSLPDELFGRWLATKPRTTNRRQDTTSSGPEDFASSNSRLIAIDRYSIQMNPGNAGYSWQCVHFPSSSSLPAVLTNNSTPLFMSSTSQPVRHERMFVRLFPNGCRPRYVCAQFRRPAPGVLLFRTSNFRPWPFVADVGENRIDCSTHFEYGSEDGDGSAYRLFIAGTEANGDPERLRTVTDRPFPVRCQSPFVEPELATVFRSDEFIVDFDLAMSCRGRFQAAANRPINTTATGTMNRRVPDGRPEVDSSRAATFKLTLFSCPALGGHVSEQSYRCVDAIGFGGNGSSSRTHKSARVRRLLTITGSDIDVMCWLFPPASPTTARYATLTDRFFLLLGASCYDDEVIGRLLTENGNDSHIGGNHSEFKTGSRRHTVLATFTRLWSPNAVAELLESRQTTDLDNAYKVDNVDVERNGSGNSTELERSHSSAITLRLRMPSLLCTLILLDLLMK